VKLQFEVKPLGTAFNGTGLTESVFTLHDVGGTPTPLLISGLSNKTLYKWRVRQVERSTGIGYILLPRSRWYYPAGVAPTESHFQVSDDDLPLPVELLSFRGELTLQGVQLTWQTASEQNNAGFEVRRKTAGEDFVTIASYRFDPSLRGKGTTSSTTTYSFVDATVEAGKTYTYRLRSVDYDGTIHDYAQTVSVEVREPVQARVYEYALEQNYPNPFNPTTTIRYSLKETGKVSLRVYDVIGREVKVLVDGVQGAGEYSVVMDATGLSSGVYVYQLRAGGYVFTRKMMLVK
jgi:hypothetical protein